MTTDTADRLAELPPIDEEDRRWLSYNPNTSDIVDWIQRYALAALAKQQATKVTREFTNELGNAIRITIEGPTSTSENILTPREVSELHSALNEQQAAPDAEQPRKQCVLCWEKARVGNVCDACHDSMGTAPQSPPSQVPAAQSGGEVAGWQMRTKFQDREWSRWSECADHPDEPREMVTGPLTMQFRPFYLSPSPQEPAVAQAVPTLVQALKTAIELVDGAVFCGHELNSIGETKLQTCRDVLLAARVTPSQAIDKLDAERHGLDTDEMVCFYEQDFYVLSNFSSFQVRWRDIDFATSEHAYHCEKFFSTVVGIAHEIQGARSAHDAFKIAERNKTYRRFDWDEVKVDIMRGIIRAKAEQHEYVRRKLMATGDRLLVENSWRDDYWGWGPNRDGKNMLGRLWMEVRSELRAAIAATGEQKP